MSKKFLYLKIIYFKNFIFVDSIRIYSFYDLRNILSRSIVYIRFLETFISNIIE